MNFINFSHARTALKYGLQQIGLKTNDFILIPEYICDVALQPLTQLGISYKYYPVNDALSPLYDTLENLIDNNTKAIMMVHYFGQPQNISTFKTICKKYKLLLIEDNAHGHGGKVNGQLLGTFGDLGISSPRKTLNTYSGGLLWLKEDEFNHETDLVPYPISLAHHILNSLFHNYHPLKYFIKKILKSRPKYEDPRAFREPIMPDYAIEKRSAGIIEQTDWNELRKSRQKGYHKWQNFSLDNDLFPVFENLHPEANPWCFPAYARNHEEAIKWFDWGWNHNVEVFSWPSLPEEVLGKKGESLNRWERLICFGIE